MSTPNQQTTNDQLANLQAHLLLIKNIDESKKQEEFCHLLDNAQKVLGDTSPHIAVFYYDYGSFLLGKLQSNMDLFNAGAVPNAQEDDFIDEYDEFYDQDSLDGQNGANNQQGEKKQVAHEQEEKKEKINQKQAEKTQKQPIQNGNLATPQKVVYEDENVQITQVDDKMKQKMEENQAINAPQEEQQQLTDIEICYENFQAALNIYNRQLSKIQNGQHSPLQKRDIIKYIFHIHGRMGELYLMDQKYEECIDEFRTVIKMASNFDHPQTKRICSEAHFNIGNALLHQNNAGCQQTAINEYVDAIINLLKYIQETEHYNISAFQIPSLQKPRVDRYQYLKAPFDNQIVADIKESISSLLDKIEDTFEQIGVRGVYEAEKQKMNQQKQDSGFKQVPKDVKVTNLGTFGNRKRTPAQAQQINSSASSILNGLNPLAPKSAEKQPAVINPQSAAKEQQILQNQAQETAKNQSETKNQSQVNAVSTSEQKPQAN